MARELGFSFDMRGFDKMVEAVSRDKRKDVVAHAMRAGANIIQNKIRSNYKKLKPGSNLDKAIVLYEYPSGEGAIVRRFYVKGGLGNKYDKDGPIYRSYILNYIEKGATDRRTKGKGPKRNGPKYRGLNRGSIPATGFFRKGYNSSKNKAAKEIERLILSAIAKQARKQ